LSDSLGCFRCDSGQYGRSALPSHLAFVAEAQAQNNLAAQSLNKAAGSFMSS